MNKELLQQILRKEFDKHKGNDMILVYDLIIQLHNIHNFDAEWIEELTKDYEFELDRL